MKRDDGAYCTRGEMESRIRQQEQKIRRLTVENDNLHERIRKIEAAFPNIELPSELSADRIRELDEYAEGLPV